MSFTFSRSFSKRSPVLRFKGPRDHSETCCFNVVFSPSFFLLGFGRSLGCVGDVFAFGLNRPWPQHDLAKGNFQYSLLGCSCSILSIVNDIRIEINESRSVQHLFHKPRPAPRPPIPSLNLIGIPREVDSSSHFASAVFGTRPLLTATN